MRLFRLCSLIVLTFSVQACSPLYLLNTVISDNSYKPTHNLSYGQNSEQQLDIYTPGKISCTDCPVIVFFHGGGWFSGNKDQYKFLGEAFASEGFIVVIPGYRLYPKVRFPIFIEDAAQSIHWVRDNIHTYGGNPDNINLMGHSAGAHITMMLAFDHQYLSNQNIPLNSIRSAVGLAGPYDFLPSDYDYIANVFSTAIPPEIGEPIFFADKTSYPILLATGLKDKRVNPENSFKLAEKLKTKSGDVKLITYPETGHAGILLSISKPLRYLSPAFMDILTFIREASR